MKLITVDDRLLMEYHFDKVRSSFNPKSTDDFYIDSFTIKLYWGLSKSIDEFCDLIRDYISLGESIDD